MTVKFDPILGEVREEDSSTVSTIVGITGTKAEFNDAVTDGDIVYVGEALSDGTAATTQPAGDNSTKIATTEYTDTGLALKQNSLGFTAENVVNKSTTTTLGTSNILYPTQNAVKTYVDTATSGGGGLSSIFEATISGGQGYTGTSTIVSYGVANVNVGSNYNAGTFKYTAPSAGTYRFFAYIRFSGVSNGNTLWLQFWKSGVNVKNLQQRIGDVFWGGTYIEKVVSMGAGQTMEVRAYNSNSIGTMNGGITESSFSGYKLA